MAAIDLALMTSFTEGSPQFIKEALACNCPVVSTDVGDVKILLNPIDGSFICSYLPEDVAKKIKIALENNNPVLSRTKIKHLDNQLIAQQIIKVYTME